MRRHFGFLSEMYIIICIHIDVCEAVPVLKDNFSNINDSLHHEEKFSLFHSSLDPCDWSYGGSNGPLQWPRLVKGCAGVRQSPINIDTKSVRYSQSLKPITLVRTTSGSLPTYELKNNGHTVLVEFPPIWEITFQVEAVTYCFRPLQMHWHWGSKNSEGSEHRINDKAFPLELHLVTYNCRDFPDSAAAMKGPNGLAVFGVFYEIDDSASTDPILDSITNKFKLASFRQCKPCTGSVPKESIPGFDIANALPSNVKDFYRYFGSLTTPPCTENVLWTVFSQTKKISSLQMAAFRSLLYQPSFGDNKPMVNNYRPVELLNPISPVSTIRLVSASFNIADRTKTDCAVTVLVIAFLSSLMLKY